jgi:hypothetical protein
MTKTLLALSSVALAAALVGCGNGSDGSPSASPTANEYDQGLKFAQCMRKNGIDMEDPKPGQGVTVRVQKGGEAKMKAAQEACKAFSPMQNGGKEMTAEELDKQTKLAQCLRREGIDVEAPKPGQPFQMKMRAGNEAKTNAAMKTCHREAGIAEPGGGGPGPAAGGAGGKG